MPLGLVVVVVVVVFFVTLDDEDDDDDDDDDEDDDEDEDEDDEEGDDVFVVVEDGFLLEIDEGRPEGREEEVIEKCGSDIIGAEEVITVRTQFAPLQ